MTAGSGTEIDDVVGAADGVLIMLDDKHGIAQIAQRLESFQQALVVAMMQPDRRLVQHIQHAAKAGADLGRQPDALAFASTQRCGRAVKRHVAQADGIQEAESLSNFFQNAPGNALFAGIETDAGSGFEGAPNRQRREISDRHRVHLHRQALRPQTPAATSRAFRGRHVIQHPLAIAFRAAVFQRPAKISKHAEEAAALLLTRLRPIQDEVLRLRRKLLERFGQIESVRRGGELKRVDQVLRRRAWPEASLKQRLRPIRDDLGRIKVVFAAQTIAFGARAVNAVEGERTRLQNRNVDAAFRTRQL